MRKYYFLLISFFLFSSFLSKAQWVFLEKGTLPKTTMTVVSSTEKQTVIRCKINAYRFRKVNDGVTVEVPKGSFIQEKGMPDLQKIAMSFLIPNVDEMQVKIVSSHYIEVKDINVLPSKGILKRTVNPSIIPYSYGKIYYRDEFYPAKMTTLRKPYIIRDHRAQTVWVYPLQYNPVQKVLRIYTDITLMLKSTGKQDTVNIIANNHHHFSNESFNRFYQRHFINYRVQQQKRYTPIEEGHPGRMLVITDSALQNAIMPFVSWKREKGIYTEVVTVQSIGNTATDIKAYVKSYYDNHADFSYLLLVGDGPQVAPSSTSAGVSDNDYGYLAGDDHYIDIFVGRFSAENESQLKTQVERTLQYERDMDTTAVWLGNALGIASNEGTTGGGDDGESDKEHMENIRTDLETYGYVVNKVYQGEEVDTDITNFVNAGTGLINYVGHGDVQLWHSVNPHDYTNTNVNNLVNTNKLPFIWSVACQVGNFKNNTCFSEAWLRATDSTGKPTGAIDMIGSTIDQSWASPMDAQDEMVDILVGNYSDNKKILFGGLIANGWGHMIDEYGSDGENMADTWVCFGDPSLMVRTKQPKTMQITHADVIPQGSYTFDVNCDEEGALVSITHQDTIYGTAYVSGGTAHVEFYQPLNDTDSALITVTAFDKVTYQKYLHLLKVTELPIAKFGADTLEITAGEKVAFIDSSENYPLYWHWHFDGAVDTVSTKRNPIVEYDSAGTYSVQLIVQNNNGADTLLKSSYITVNPITLPPDADFIASDTLIHIGDTVTFTDLSTRLPNQWHWEFEGGDIDSSNLQFPVVRYDSIGDYTVSLIVGNSIGLDTLVRTAYIHVLPPEYCDAKVSYKDEYISAVKCDTLNNTSDWTEYSDYTDRVITCMQGHDLQMNVSIAHSYSNDRLYVWCDWNLDGDFDDAGETVYRSSSSSSTYSFTISVPDTAHLVTTRMRIRLNYNSGSGSNTTPCGNATYGEVEDYSLFVQKDTTTEDTTTSAIELCENHEDLVNIYPNPTKGIFYVTGNGIKTIEVVDVLGQIIYTKSQCGEYEQVQLSAKSGIYFIRLTMQGKQVVRKLIIK